MAFSIKELIEQLLKKTGDRLLPDALSRLSDGLVKQEKDLAALKTLLENPHRTFGHDHKVPRCIIYHDASQNTNTGVETTLAFNQTFMDTDQMHDNAVNNPRITFRTAGWYWVGLNISWDDNSTGSRFVSIRSNLRTVATYIGIVEGPASPGTRETRQQVVAFSHFDREDYLEFTVFQNSGGVLAITHTLPARFSPWAWAFMVDRATNPDFLRELNT